MKIKLTESKLKQIVAESVKRILSEDFNNDESWREHVDAQRKPLEDLLKILKRYGIESAHVSEYRTGVPRISISTDEYNEKNVWEIANKFAESRKMYVSEDSYPATTHIRLNQL